MRVFLEDVSIWTGDLGIKQMALPKVGGHHPVHWGPEQNKEAEDVGIHFLPECGAETWIFCPRCSWFLGLQTGTGIYITGSPTLRPSNYTTALPASPACRWQTRGLLSLFNHTRQYLIINLSLSISLSLSLSREHWPIQHLKWRKFQWLVCALTVRVAGQELGASSSSSKSKVLPWHCMVGGCPLQNGSLGANSGFKGHLSPSTTWTVFATHAPSRESEATRHWDFSRCMMIYTTPALNNPACSTVKIP